MQNIEDVTVYPPLASMPPMDVEDVADALIAALPTLSRYGRPPLCLQTPTTCLLVHRQEGSYGLVLVWERSVRASGYHQTLVCPCRGRYVELRPLTADTPGYQALVDGLQRLVGA